METVIQLNKKIKLQKGNYYHLKNKCGVYKITNIVSNKIYIGSSIELDNRLYRHTRDLELSIHKNFHLQNSFNKHGIENFVYEILSFCEYGEELKYEQFFMDTLIFAKEYRDSDSDDLRFKEVSFNICPIAGNTIGWKATDAQKEANRLNTIKNWENPEFRRKQEEYNALPSTFERKSKQHTEVMSRPDVKAKIIASNIATKNSPEYKAKDKITREDPAYIEMHRENTTKLWENPEYRAKIHSDESSAKTSETVKDLWEDEEYRKKQMEVRADPKFYKNVVNKRLATMSDPSYVNPNSKTFLMKDSITDEVLQEFKSLKIVNEYLQEKYKDKILKRGYRKDAKFLIKNNLHLDGVYFEYK